MTINYSVLIPHTLYMTINYPVLIPHTLCPKTCNDISCLLGKKLSMYCCSLSGSVSWFLFLSCASIDQLAGVPTYKYMLEF